MSTCVRCDAARGVVYYLDSARPLTEAERGTASIFLHERMVEVVIADVEQAEQMFATYQGQPMVTIDMLRQGRRALVIANEELGLALARAVQFAMKERLAEAPSPRLV